MVKGINKAYSDIHKNYDAINFVVSLGTMKIWRKIAARQSLYGSNAKSILDIATGTGDLAFDMEDIARRKGIKISITATDLNPDMLKIARKKAAKRNSKVKFEVANAEKLMYKDGSFDLLTSGFGIKHIEDLSAFSKGMYRILRNGGGFVFIEMGRPKNRISRAAMDTYVAVVCKAFGILGNGSYAQIISSINNFDKMKFVGILKKSGFKEVKTHVLAPGPAFIISGKKVT